MSFEEQISLLSERVRSYSSTMETEEAVKTAVVLPFLRALGYDVFDPSEVVPEFTADAVGKKGEKVDYAIKIDGEVRILIECKPITTNLDRVHLAQLFRYFTVTSAKFAILTNGRTWHFHTDLEEPNKLDARPFLSFDLSDFQQHVVSELRKFARSDFDVDGILASAERLKYTSSLKSAILEIIENPPEDFVRIAARGLYEGKFTSSVKDQFTSLVRSAFREVIRDSVKSRISSALDDNDQPTEETPAPVEDEIITTEEEIEGYMIVKSIVREVIAVNRVGMRDAKSYCAILVDNNNRKPLARLHFNRSIKYVGLFDKDTEERVQIDSLDGIYAISERLKETAQRYAD